MKTDQKKLLKITPGYEFAINGKGNSSNINNNKYSKIYWEVCFSEKYIPADDNTVLKPLHHFIHIFRCLFSNCFGYPLNRLLFLYGVSSPLNLKSIISI